MLISNSSGTRCMRLAAASEKEGKELGTPQTPAGGLRPPAPPAQELCSLQRMLLVRGTSSIRAYIC